MFHSHENIFHQFFLYNTLLLHGIVRKHEIFCHKKFQHKNTLEPLNKDTFGTSRFVEVVLFQRQFSIECVYKSTFGSSFGRFVLFRSVLYRRFHCKPKLRLAVIKMDFCAFNNHTYERLRSRLFTVKSLPLKTNSAGAFSAPSSLTRTITSSLFLSLLTTSTESCLL